MFLLFYFLLVPSSPPVDVIAISFTSTNTMNVTWDPPLELNGELTSYKIVFEDQLEDDTWQTRQIMTCSPQVTLVGLDINTRYRIKVAASTRKGFGPFSEVVYGGNLWYIHEDIHIWAESQLSKSSLHYRGNIYNDGKLLKHHHNGEAYIFVTSARFKNVHLVTFKDFINRINKNHCTQHINTTQERNAQWVLLSLFGLA